MIKLSNVVFKIIQIFGHTSYVDVTKWKLFLHNYLE